jgi:hypothetical protein
MSTNDAPLKVIPPADVVLHHLANALRDARLLRSLLKLSKRAEQERVQRSAKAQEVQRAS